MTQDAAERIVNALVEGIIDEHYDVAREVWFKLSQHLSTRASDRNPPLGMPVLVRLSTGKHAVAYRSWKGTDLHWLTDFDHQVVEDVTDWWPLPELESTQPKETT